MGVRAARSTLAAAGVATALAILAVGYRRAEPIGRRQIIYVLQRA